MKKGYIYSILSAVLFGTCGIVIKTSLSQGIDSITLLILQYLIAIPIMIIFMLIIDKDSLIISKKDLYHAAVLGVIGNTFMTVFYYLAFDYLDVSVVTILLYTYPIMVFIYSAVFERVKIGVSKILLLCVAFIGCFLALGILKGMGTFSAIGIVYGILSAVFYAFMNIYTEKKMSNMNSFSINFYSILFSFISLILVKLPHIDFYINFNIKLVVSVLLLAVMCEIIPLTLLYSAIKKIGSLRVSIIGNLEIPTAMFLSVLILKENVTILQVIGAFMVIYAVYSIRKID
ncbi:DMT family transporter [Clostridium fermenticellae]|uniref:DMT family transporter n=1 Tax=Clostridium fermenticellae TaxID=2068654 RepID=A0A386H2P1_9CLOT|nr:DMT family transporter [Clostridium fermenticellae]AYD39940.1 DMT family transporter [Clostridium fermenticellae]